MWAPVSQPAVQELSSVSKKTVMLSCLTSSYIYIYIYICVLSPCLAGNQPAFVLHDKTAMEALMRLHSLRLGSSRASPPALPAQAAQPEPSAAAELAARRRAAPDEAAVQKAQQQQVGMGDRLVSRE